MSDRSVSRGRSRTPGRTATAASEDARMRSRSTGTRDQSMDSRSRSRSRTPGSPHSGSKSPDSKPRSAKIVIEKLTKNVNVSHLREIFSTYGSISDLEMPMNKHFMTNRGIAYVLYTQPSYAEAAISNMHEAQLDGALISVSIVLPRRRFTRSPPAMRPPPNRFGEPHRFRDGPPPLPGMRGGRGSGGGGRGGRSPPRYGGGPPGRGGGPGGYRDRYEEPPRDSYRPRSYSRSRSPLGRRGGRSPSYSGRSRSPSRSPPLIGNRGGPRGGGGRGRGGGRRRSRSYSSYSSRSRSRSPSRDRGRGRR